LFLDLFVTGVICLGKLPRILLLIIM